MIFLLLRLYLSSSCAAPCRPCEVENLLFIKNPCTYAIYYSYDSQDIGCANCLLDSGISTDCTSISYTSMLCTLSDSCGPSTLNSFSDSISTSSLPSSSICSYHIDLTSSSTKDLTVSINFHSSNVGSLILRSYNLPKGVSYKNSKAIQYSINKSNYYAYKHLALQESNYLIIVHYSGNDNLLYSGINISWSDPDGSSSGSLSQILTITALCLVSVFCMGCCGVLCRRLYKSARGTNRVYDQAVTTFQRRARAYEALPDNSVLSDEEIQRFFPRQLYNESLLEVGEKVCCICFEEFNPNIYVRKLPCKHVFHAKCIEDWFVGRMVHPRCPLCKNNPFSGQIERDEVNEEPK